MGGGGGGCGGIKQGRGRSGIPVVNIIHVSGPKTVNVSIGGGGLGEKGHSVESVSNGLSTRFGNHVTALGGRGCTREGLGYSLMEARGIRHLRLSEVTTGKTSINVYFAHTPFYLSMPKMVRSSIYFNQSLPDVGEP